MSGARPGAGRLAKGWCRRRGDQGRGPARPRAGAGRLALLMLAREGARRIRRRPAGPVQAASPGDAQRGRPAGPSAAVGPGAPPAGSPNQHQSGSAPQSESPRHCGRAATADAEAGASDQAGAGGPRAGSSPGPSVQTPGAGGRRKDAAPGMGSSAVRACRDLVPASGRMARRCSSAGGFRRCETSPPSARTMERLCPSHSR